MYTPTKEYHQMLTLSSSSSSIDVRDFFLGNHFREGLKTQTTFLRAIILEFLTAKVETQSAVIKHKPKGFNEIINASCKLTTILTMLSKHFYIKICWPTQNWNERTKQWNEWENVDLVLGLLLLCLIVKRIVRAANDFSIPPSNAAQACLFATISIYHFCTLTMKL